jgi:cell division protein FtsZ
MILGIGGAGNNTVSRLVESGLTGAEVVAINTDLRDLNSTSGARKVLIGENITRGLSTCGNSEVGRAAAEESRPYIESLLENVDVVFITVGLGGGTGTGAAPVVADIARRRSAVVVGVVTTPMRTEKGQIRDVTMALHEMRRVCHTVVVVDGSKLMELTPQLQMTEAFKVADQVLASMIKGIVETLTTPSLINMDFADFKMIMKKGGIAIVGVGESDAPNRAEEAVRNALRTTFMNASLARAKGALVHVSGGVNVTVEEVNRVGEIVTEAIGQNALVSWGARVSPQTEGPLKVTLVMTGVRSPYRLSRFVNLMPRLYDIESSFSEPEKPPHIDLGLDQIEGIED